MDFTRGQLVRPLAILSLFLVLSQPAHAAGFADVVSPIKTVVSALESALGNIVAFIEPHHALAQATQPSPTADHPALSAAAADAAGATSSTSTDQATASQATTTIVNNYFTNPVVQKLIETPAPAATTTSVTAALAALQAQIDQLHYALYGSSTFPLAHRGLWG